jgi:virginiamycin B lyase
LYTPEPAGQLSLYDSKTDNWKEWKAPGNNPQICSEYVDNKDIVWLSDFGANATLRVDPKTEQSTILKSKSHNASVRQFFGRPGEMWLPESGADKLVVVRE